MMGLASSRQRDVSGGVASTERHTAHLGPLTLVVTLDDFMAWFKSSKKSDKTVYAEGPSAARGNAVFIKAYDLYASGHLEIFQPRGDRGFDFTARRTAKPLREAGDAPQAEQSALDLTAKETIIAGTELGNVLDILKRAANFGRQAPSLGDLAQLANLTTGNVGRQRARYLKGKLAKQGFIKIEAKQGCVAVVEILSSGKKTRGGV